MHVFRINYWVTTATSEHNVIISYVNSVQGFFSKPTKYEKLRDVIKNIVDYRTKCTETKFTNFGSYPVGK